MAKIGNTPLAKTSSVQHSGKQYLRHMKYLVYGPPGVGKTTLALTMSKKWKGISKQPKTVMCDDVFWMAADINATECLEALNYRVNEVRLQDGLMRLPAPGEHKHVETHPLRAYSEMIKAASCAVADGATTVVLDTASELNAVYLAYLVNEQPDRPTMQLYGKLGEWEEAGFRKLLQLPCHIVVLCHEKQHIDYGDKESARKKMSTVTPYGEYTFQPDISGKALRAYYRVVSLGMSLQAYKDTRTKQWVRYLTTVATTDGHIGKSRYLQQLDAQEPADLGALTQKLQKGK